MLDKPKLTQEAYEEHVAGDDGICLACYAWNYGDVEPDAEGYPCSECGADEVMGAEQALMEEEIELLDDEDEA